MTSPPVELDIASQLNIRVEIIARVEEVADSARLVKLTVAISATIPAAS